MNKYKNIAVIILMSVTIFGLSFWGFGKEVDEFCEQLEKSKSGPLHSIGDGVHYHTVEADTETVLDEIGKALEMYAI